MKDLRTLLRLRPDDRRLLVRTLVLVAIIRIALWILPFQRLRRVLAKWTRPRLSHTPSMPVSRLVWAVKAASRRVPGASCLTQSLALRCLLTWAGHRSEVRIGVAKEAEAGFGAHAWVEYAGQPLLSGPEEVNRYVQLLTLEDNSA